MNIKDVREFWNKNPLLSGEIKQPLETREWFNEFYRIKSQGVFLNDLTEWITPMKSGGRMLDVGCGPGYWMRIAKDYPVRYFGIDLSDISVGLAKKSKKIFAVQGNLIVGDAEHLPFKDECFDYVISEGVIHHTLNTQQCINEFHRVLKKGGKAVVSVYHRFFLLRSGIGLYFTRLLMGIFRIGLQGRGRQKLRQASTAEEFIRMYDGKDNPIGKAYTLAEIEKMFYQFSIILKRKYYLPWRGIPLLSRIPEHLPGITRFIDRMFGLLVLIKVEK